MNGFVPCALVFEHGIIKLKCLDRITVLHLFFCNSVECNMKEWIDFAFRIELTISQNIGKFKLIKIFIGVIEHDFRQPLFLFV